ncbi:superoxide dismutase [Candidatus Kaiserbacteria bacterium]|nr:superoxide dismutase [Candidatus Kaiserbacteria bacterium]
MSTYTPRKFAFGNLVGISPKQIDVHLKLYEGYVKNLNLLQSVLDAYGHTTDEGGKYSLSEVRRRFGFEWNGMRMHEHYFAQWEGSSAPLTADSSLGQALAAQYGSMDAWMVDFKTVGSLRGIGWAILSYDPAGKTFFNHWVSDHELGQLNSTVTILALDLWEHAYMVDYTPAEKAKYIEAFFRNLNGEVVNKRFE